MQVEEIPKYIRATQCKDCMSFSCKWGCNWNKLHIRDDKCFYFADKNKDGLIPKTKRDIN